MELKDRFENQHTQPSPQVWNHIEHTLYRQRKLRRWKRWGGAILATIGIVACVQLLSKTTSDTHQAANLKGNDNICNNETFDEATLPDTKEIRNGNTPIAEVRHTHTPLTGSQHGNTAQLIAATPAEIIASKPAAANTALGTNHQGVVTNSNPIPAATNNTTSSTASPAQEQPDLPTIKSKGNTTEALCLMIPNAFAPNDASTEVRVFKPVATENSHIVSFFMQIYNRSGALVFSTRDINTGWDGKLKGSDMPMGTYVYIIEYKDATTGIHRQKGTVVLIR